MPAGSLDVAVVDLVRVQVLQRHQQRQHHLSSHILLLQHAAVADQLFEQVALQRADMGVYEPGVFASSASQH